MKVLFLGEYGLERYSRARVLSKGLIERGIEIEFCLEHSKKKFLKFTKRLMNPDFDYLVVWSGPEILAMCRLLKVFYRRPLIYDQFLSIYDTNVFDRKIVDKDSLKAKILWAKDWMTCRTGDSVIFDTKEHKAFFERTYNFDSSKAFVVPVGADDQIFKPQKKINRKFIVLFYGSFLPLQGTEVILKAAKLCPDIRFNMIGSGQSRFESSLELADELKLSNIYFNKKFILPEELIDWISASDICLGIFGTTDKAKRVVPNKVYEALAMAKPLITAETKAIRTIGLKHNEHCYFTKPGDPRSLADAIYELKKRPSLRKKIAKSGHKWYLKNASPAAVADKFLESIKKIF